MIKEVIFDCFGVLTQDGWLAFTKKYGTNENINQLNDINHKVDSGELSYDDFLNEVSNLTGVLRQEAHKIISDNYQPNEQVFELAEQLKSRGFYLGIISNASNVLSNYLPSKSLEIFDYITLSFQESAIKPEPEIYKAHLKKSGFLPNEVIFIDDRKVNCEGAKAVGIKAIHYQNIAELKRDLDVIL